MKRDKVKKLIETLAEEAEAAAKKVGPDFEKERIHEFRVGVKSLRALIRLAESLNEQGGFKLNSDLKEIYHISGSIRDAQLEHEKIKHLDIPIPGYLKNLEHIITENKETWQKCFSKKALRNLESANSTAEVVITPELVDRFISKKLASVSQISRSEKLTDDELHSIRKQFKDIFYVLKIVPKDLKSISDGYKPTDIHELKVITDETGAYNDDRIFMEHIRDYIQTSGVPVDTKLKKYIAYMALELKDWKELICEQVNKFVGLKVAG